MQVTYPKPSEDDELAALVSTITDGSFVRITGQLKHDERVKLGGIEILLETLEIESMSLPESPIAEDTSIDKRLDWRFLDYRRPEMRLMTKVQTEIEASWRKYWLENEFTEIHTPKLMSSPSESHAELFKLEYFEGHAYLAQSPQFYKQMAMASGLGKIFEIGPVFRADPSFTARHATEFVSVDMEVSYIDSHTDIMDIQEQLMIGAIQSVKDKYGEQIKELLDVEITVPTAPFPRIALAEAHEILKKHGYEVPRSDGDLDPEGERQISAVCERGIRPRVCFSNRLPQANQAFLSHASRGQPKPDQEL